MTETHLADDVDVAIEIISDLREIGINVAIDDFGTGFSSLGQLKNLPVDNLKIDRIFVRDMLSEARNAAIVETIINLGHSLDMRVIAEGVETAEQVSYLRHFGCDEVQGFYYGRPVPAEDFVQWLGERARVELEPVE